MRSILLTISLIAFTLLAVGQENKAKESKVDIQTGVSDDHDLEIQKLQNEIQDITRRIKKLNSAIAPENEKGRAIHRTKMNELQYEKMWKEKELSIARVEAKGNDVTGMRGEADALHERYVAMRDKRIHLEREAAAQQAEMDDETAVPNQKLKMQKNELQEEIKLKEKTMAREQRSPNPDAERIATLKGEIEKLQRQVNELKE